MLQCMFLPTGALELKKVCWEITQMALQVTSGRSLFMLTFNIFSRTDLSVMYDLYCISVRTKSFTTCDKYFESLYQEFDVFEQTVKVWD